MVAHRLANHEEGLQKFTPALPMQHDTFLGMSDKNSSGSRGSEQQSSGGGLQILICPHPNCSTSGNQYLHAFQLELHTAVNHTLCRVNFVNMYFKLCFRKSPID